MGGTVQIYPISGEPSGAGKYLSVNPGSAIGYDGQKHSISGVTAAGGFAGSGATITNSYCTGHVLGQTDASATGAFTGSGSSGSDNFYYEIMNGDMNPVAGETKAAMALFVTALDEDKTSFNSFCLLSAPAQPYDAQLTAHYQGKYLFQTIGQLKNETYTDTKAFTADLTTHFGDWPEYETLVVNT